MNFSIHIDDRTAKSLAREVRRSGKTRNALIGEAVRQYLDQSRISEWPAELLEAQPLKGLKPFESFRRKERPAVRFP